MIAHAHLEAVNDNGLPVQVTLSALGLVVYLKGIDKAWQIRFSSCPTDQSALIALLQDIDAYGTKPVPHKPCQEKKNG
jgi:hypothetical protein